jgi:putative CocE/NonD family hydrolase
MERLSTWLTTRLIACCTLLQAAHGIAQNPAAGVYSPEQYEVRERHNVEVPMRDQVILHVDLYRPALDARVPVILCITPYGKTNLDLPTPMRIFARRGYAVAVADSRGRYDSEGTWDPDDPKQKTDGYDLVEWLAAQPWSTGKVGMIGGSYSGLTQWFTAVTAPPHLAAIVPAVSPPDGFENVPYQNGVLTGAWALDWEAAMSGRTLQVVGPGTYFGWTARNGDLTHTPYIDINAFRGMEHAPWFGDRYRQNKSTDPRWRAISYQGEHHYSHVAVPSLSITGWFDANYPGGPMNYVGMKRFGATAEARRPALIIGPWNHGINERVVAGIDYGPEASIDLNGYIVRWFDHFLKGIDNDVEKDQPVHVFVMGENKWRAEKDWPVPESALVNYYLDSGGHANSSTGDGLLSTVAPLRDRSDTYTYDPLHPTRDPFESLSNHNGHLDGAVDTGPSSTGDEVLVYRTPPLQAPVEVIGPIEATLFAKTTARDTDWMVRLVDVQPDGRSLLLTEGVVRARNRDSSDHGRFNAAQLSIIEPNRIYEYVIRFWRGTANLFQRGHCIRVEISSSWYPYFLPNLNSGADNLALVPAAEAVVAQQTVRHGPRYPSRITLPVVSVHE